MHSSIRLRSWENVAPPQRLSRLNISLSTSGWEAETPNHDEIHLNRKNDPSPVDSFFNRFDADQPLLFTIDGISGQPLALRLRSPRTFSLQSEVDIATP